MQADLVPPLWTCAKHSINIVASKKPEEISYGDYRRVRNFANLFSPAENPAASGVYVGLDSNKPRGY